MHTYRGARSACATYRQRTRTHGDSRPCIGSLCLAPATTSAQMCAQADATPHPLSFGQVCLCRPRQARAHQRCPKRLQPYARTCRVARRLGLCAFHSSQCREVVVPPPFHRIAFADRPLRRFDGQGCGCGAVFECHHRYRHQRLLVLACYRRDVLSGCGARQCQACCAVSPASCLAWGPLPRQVVVAAANARRRCPQLVQLVRVGQPYRYSFSSRPSVRHG